MPIIRSSRVLYKWLLPVVFGALVFKLSVWCGAEGYVLKCDGTRAETRFRLSAKRTSPFKSAGTSVQSTTSNRDVRISGSNAGYTMFRGSMKSTLSSTPYRQLENQSIKYHRQQPLV